MKKFASGYGNLAGAVIRQIIRDLCGESIRDARAFFMASTCNIAYKKHFSVLCDLAGPVWTDRMELAKKLVLSGATTEACKIALMKKAPSANIVRRKAQRLHGKARRERVEALNDALRAVWKPEMTCSEAAERLGIPVEHAAAVGRRTGLKFRPLTKAEKALCMKKAWNKRRARAGAGH